MNLFRDYLITDRSPADVERVRHLRSLWGPAPGQWRGTEEERAEWEAGLKGAYNALDLNRLTLAAFYLFTKLAEMGYEVPEDSFPAYLISINGAGRGGGLFYEGDEAKVEAAPPGSSTFMRWEEGGETVSTNPAYNFTVEESRTLTPVYRERGPYVPVGSSAYLTADGKEYWYRRFTNG